MTDGQRRPTTLDELAAAQKKFITDSGYQKALGFKAQPGDIFIAPFGKSGTTWLQHIAHGLRTRGSMDFEEMGARTLPGKREEPNRAGITPKILRGTEDHTIKPLC